MPRCYSRRSFGALITLGLCLNFAMADAAEFPMCRNGTFPKNDRDGFREGVVTGEPGTRVHFFDDDAAKGCPTGDPTTCKDRAYVVPGDRLMIAYIQDGWVCGYYRKKSFGSGYAGWMPADGVKLLPTNETPSVDQWLGKWKAWDDSITIKRAPQSDPKSNMLQLYGDGHWHAPGYDDHFGNFSGTARPEGNHLHIEDDGCAVTLTLINNRLLAKDNHSCGGINVTFSQVYDRD